MTVDAERQVLVDPVARECARLLSRVTLDVAAGVAANERLTQLLRSNQLIIGDLLMPIVLRRIAEAARTVADARGCILVLRSQRGDVTDAVGYEVDSLELASVKAAAQTSTARAPMVPGYHATEIRTDDRVFGTIYLAQPLGGALLSRNLELIDALANTAAVAIHNAELFDESRHRQHWLQASTEIFRQLLSGSADEHLGLITSRARDIADADAVTLAVGRRDGTSLEVRVTAGSAAEGLVGWIIPLKGSLGGKVVASGKPLLLEDFGSAEHLRVPLPNAETAPGGPALILPLIGSGDVRGVLSMVRLRGRPPFTSLDLELATAFASQAALALDLSEARLHQQRMMLLEDRDRIARDLHDHVIQRLFAAGLSLQSIAKSMSTGTATTTGTPIPADSENVADRLATEVGEIDAIIRELRSSILRLRGSLAVGEDIVRNRLREIAGNARELFGFSPSLRILGTVEKQHSDAVVEQIAAVLRVVFADILRRGRGTKMNIGVVIARGWLTLTVEDDAGNVEDDAGTVEDDAGSGPGPAQDWLAQLEQSAAGRGGVCGVQRIFTDQLLTDHLSADRPTQNAASSVPTGSIMTWSVPIEHFSPESI